MVVRRVMARKFLEDAYSGESQAHMRYLIFADVAEKEGFANIARLFKAIAYAEYVHAKNHYNALGNVGSTADNLRVAIDGETYEVEEMYPVFNNAAKFQGESEAEKSTYYALSAEKIHAELYRRAKDAVEQKRDLDIKNVYICPACGFTAVDEAPEYCPVCGAERESFIVF
jgi:rubrerythrin